MAAFCMSLDNRSVESDTVAAVPNRRYVLTYQARTRYSYRPISTSLETGQLGRSEGTLKVSNSDHVRRWTVTPVSMLHL